MARTLSVDLRERVVAAVEGGMSRREAAERFGVSVASAVRWCALSQETGSVSAKPRPVLTIRLALGRTRKPNRGHRIKRSHQTRHRA